MSRFFFRFLYVLVLLLFILTAASTAFCYELTDRNAPLIQAGMMPKAPIIDGVINNDEWTGAASSNIFHLLGSETVLFPAPEMKIGFDKENLYIAVNIPLAPGYKIKAEKRDRDGQLWEDDTVEVFIDPKHDQSSDYQFSVNAVGSIAESMNKNDSWNGAWQTQSSQGNNCWQTEIKIPFNTLGIGTVDSRRVIGFNVALDKTFPMARNFTWATLFGNFHQPAMFGHVIMDPAGPVSYADLSLSKTGLDLDMGTSPVVDGINSTFTLSEGTTNLASLAQPVKPGMKLSIPFPVLDGKIKEGTYKWTSEMARSGNPIYYQTGNVEVKSVPPLSVTLRKFFIQGKLAVDADASALEVYNQDLTARIAIFDENGKETSSKSVKLDTACKGTVNFDISKDPLTKHTVKVTVVDSSGTELAVAQQSYIRPPLPGWLHSKAGISDKVLPPWTPMKTTAGKNGVKISCYGRTYTFGKLPFPTAVITRDSSILSGPIAMKLMVDGKPEILKGALKVVSKTPSRVVLKGTASAGALKADSTVTMDFDGNAFVDMKLSSDRAVSIDKFIIEAPVKRQHARYRYYFPGNFGSSINARALPAEGWKSDFVPYVWLGDNDRGFALYTTSDQYWSAKDGVKPIEVTPVGKTMALRFNIMTKPVVLSAGEAKKGLKFTFGFEATPNKKPEKDAWDYRINHSGSYGAEDTFTGTITTVDYPAGKVINNSRGTLEMWVKVCFDPNAPIINWTSRGIMNRDLVSIKSTSQTLGFYWNIDVGGMRLYLQDGSAYPIMLDTQTHWKENEIHHLALTWGDEVKVYIDGQLTSSKKWTGLLKGPSSDVSIQFAGQNPGFNIDELRISDIERQPDLQTSAYKTDEHTILLDHLDNLSKDGKKLLTVPEKGIPGIVSPNAKLTDGKFGKALVTVGKKIPTLDYMKKLGVRTIVFHENWTEYQNYSDTIGNQDKLKKFIKACHEKGIQVLLYFGYEMADICPEWDSYHNEMLVMPIQGGYTREPAQVDRIVCYNSAWQDFIADGVDKLIDKYDIDGVYLDGTSWPWACKNIDHGCGYVKPDGTIGATYAFRGARDMMRRLYTLIKAKKPNGQVNLHNSLTMTIPTIGWATSTWDGEQFGFISEKTNVEELFPLDAFRTEFMGRQWGPPAEMLCYNKPFTFHQAFSFTLLHDILVRGYGEGLDEESAIWQTMDSFGRKKAKFYPYWNNQNLVKTTPNGSYASLYVRPGKGIMCVVSNLGKDSADITTVLNLSGMKLGKNIKATNAITGENIPITNNTIKINLDSFDYTLVWIK